MQVHARVDVAQGIDVRGLGVAGKLKRRGNAGKSPSGPGQMTCHSQPWQRFNGSASMPSGTPPRPWF